MDRIVKNKWMKWLGNTFEDRLTSLKCLYHEVNFVLLADLTSDDGDRQILTDLAPSLKEFLATGTVASTPSTGISTVVNCENTSEYERISAVTSSKLIIFNIVPHQLVDSETLVTSDKSDDESPVTEEMLFPVWEKFLIIWLHELIEI